MSMNQLVIKLIKNKIMKAKYIQNRQIKRSFQLFNFSTFQNRRIKMSFENQIEWKKIYLKGCWIPKAGSKTLLQKRAVLEINFKKLLLKQHFFCKSIDESVGSQIQMKQFRKGKCIQGCWIPEAESKKLLPKGCFRDQFQKTPSETALFFVKVSMNQFVLTFK